MLKATHGIIKPSSEPVFITGSSMITYWDFQNSSSYSGSGTTITDLDGTINGTVVGSVPYTSGTPSYFFFDNGSSKYVTTSTSLNPYLSPANTGVTISLFIWIYPIGSIIGTILSEQGSTTPDAPGGWYDTQIEMVSGNKVRFGVWQYTSVVTSTTLLSTATISVNNWHYIGFTYDGSTLKGYINGQPAGTFAKNNRQTPYNNGPAGVGYYYNIGYRSGTNMLSGADGTFRLGAFHIWNDAISDAIILNNYNATKASYGL
jgi:hypothetical protein